MPSTDTGANLTGSHGNSMMDVIIEVFIDPMFKGVYHGKQAHPGVCA